MKPLRTKKREVLELPKIHFINRGDDNPGGLNVMYYPKDLNLVSLRSLVPKNKTLKMIDSNTRNALISLSSNETECKFSYKLTNNTSHDLLEYYLMYGVVPEKMSESATYLLGFWLDRQAELKNPDEYILYAGDVELMIFNYWRLSTQDLCRWKEDTSRGHAKQLLAYLWKRLSKESLKSQICAYAQFNANTYLPSALMLFIKMNYTAILNDAAAYDEKHPPKDKNTCGLQKLWGIFMRMCSVHHYRCAHTINMIHRFLDDTNKIVTTKYNELMSENSVFLSKRYRLLSQNDIFKLFHSTDWFRDENSLSSNLKFIINDLLIFLINLCSHYLIVSGIAKTCDTIEAAHIEGFVAMPTYNSLFRDSFLPEITTQSAIARIGTMFVNQINARICNSVSLARFRVSTEAMVNFMHLFSMALSRATQIHYFGMENKSMSVKDRCQGLFDEISAYMLDYQQNIRNFYAIQQNDDMTLVTMSTNNNLCVVNTENMVDESDFEDHIVDAYSSESEIEEEYDSDEIIDESEVIELTEMVRREDAFAASTIPPLIVQKHVSRSQMNKILKNLEGHFSSEPSDFKRVKCVMCFSTTTRIVIRLREDMTVPCCLPCLCVLNELHSGKRRSLSLLDTRETLTDEYVGDNLVKLLHERVDSCLKAPIFFNAINRTRAIIKTIHTTRNRCTYNRILLANEKTKEKKVVRAVKKHSPDKIIKAGNSKPSRKRPATTKASNSRRKKPKSAAIVENDTSSSGDDDDDDEYNELAKFVKELQRNDDKKRTGKTNTEYYEQLERESSDMLHFNK